jgi:hypothetical protein
LELATTRLWSVGPHTDGASGDVRTWKGVSSCSGSMSLVRMRCSGVAWGCAVTRCVGAGGGSARVSLPLPVHF